MESLERKLDMLISGLAHCTDTNGMVSFGQNLGNYIGGSIQALPFTAGMEGNTMATQRRRERVKVGIDESGKPVYEWATGNTQEELHLSVANKLITHGMTVAKPITAKHLFSTLSEEYMDIAKNGGVSPTTYNNYQQQMRKHILPFFGNMYVEDIKWNDVERFYNGLDMTKESKCKMRTVLNVVFNGAVKDGYIVQNPTALVKVKGKFSKPRGILEVSEIKDILSSIDNIEREDDKRYLAILLFHAMMPEEILGLRWEEDIDFDKHLIHIRRVVVHPDRNQPLVKEPKTQARIRDVSMQPAMEKYIKPSEPRTGFVFGGDKPYSLTTFRHMYRRIGKAVQLNGNTSYNFRHTALTDAYEATHDAKAAQALAGHATPTMCMRRYIHGRKKAADTANAIARMYDI